ncbi:MAG: hypothetical protein ACRC7N_03030 [Clostridium sp.]
MINILKKHKQNKFFKEVEKLVYSGTDIFKSLERALELLDEEDKEMVDKWLKENKPKEE